MGHFPAGGGGSGAASVTGTAPINVTPTTGAVDVSWLPTGTVSMHTEKLSHLTTPTTATQAANKSYVDSIAQGLDAKASAVAVATANVASLSGPQTIDGVTLVAGNRVLLTAQTTAKTNGLWVIQALVWTRPLTFAVASSQQGAYVLIEEGTVNKGTGWILTGAAIVVGTTNQTWSKFSTSATTKVTMGGDVTGTSTACTVGKIKATTITGNPTSAGEVLVSTASDAAHWSPLESRFVAGTGTTVTTTTHKVKISTVASSGFVATRWYGTALGVVFSVVTKKIYFYPWFIPHFPAKAIGFIVKTTAAGLVKLGIYATATGKPGARLETLGTVSTSAVGNKTKAITPVYTTPAKRVWIAGLPIHSTGTCKIRSGPASSAVVGIGTWGQGFATLTAATTAANIAYAYVSTATFTTLPATAPASLTSHQMQTGPGFLLQANV